MDSLYLCEFCVLFLLAKTNIVRWQMCRVMLRSPDKSIYLLTTANPKRRCRTQYKYSPAIGDGDKAPRLDNQSHDASYQSSCGRSATQRLGPAWDCTKRLRAYTVHIIQLKPNPCISLNCAYLSALVLRKMSANRFTPIERRAFSSVVFQEWC